MTSAVAGWAKGSATASARESPFGSLPAGWSLPAMILCVTLNACLDKTLTVPAWQPGDNVRGTEVREVVGGKGNNVARALRRLGRPARPVTFLGGPVGQRCMDLLRLEPDLDPDHLAERGDRLARSSPSGGPAPRPPRFSTPTRQSRPMKPRRSLGASRRICPGATSGPSRSRDRARAAQPMPFSAT